MVSPFVCRSRILLIGVSWVLTLVLGLSSLRMVESFASGNPGWSVLGRNNIRLPSLAAEKKKWNADAYETDRLAKDKESMDSMRSESEVEFAKLRTPWKWVIRKRIWDLLESKDIARPPRPVHHRIPNFDGALQAAERLATLPEFQAASCVKVNPDTPQKPVRKIVLTQGKTLLTPQPRLRTGFFSILSKESLPKGVRIADCIISKGVAQHGTPVGLDEEYTVDLVVVGSTGVCPQTGARVGKGEGFAELEWGILSLQGNIDAEQTLVVTTVHDEQVVDDIPAGQLTKHDVPVDIIVTPTRIIRVPNRAPKPSGVFWDLLSPQKLAQIKVLRQLKEEIEEETGQTLPSGPDELLPPTAKRNRSKKQPSSDATRKATE
eukprot:CAMPEP_0198291374 /NCGR_PEP_ID=MMETSP1449-20131203/8919_1 /TAXON_ID=420275 /ORGANISM="Attheya septentrionalis, Strain CCMP2084" /LENGTH=376 /DNA_ID=CAMNT_0043990001 /DNA_START=1541 /DNA_END=2671 /DNA_ORIENTATION=-